MTAQPFPFKTSISKEEIELLDMFAYDGPLRIIDTKAKLDRFKKKIDPTEVIGFDTETRPAFKKGQYNDCSLVQLAFKDEVVLFRLHLIGFPTVISDLLSDERFTKIGIAIHDDLRELCNIRPFEPSKFVDLNVECPKIGFENIGAKKLTAMVLDKRISKRQQVSNWERKELTEAQVKYAATDAWICREIYRKILNEGLTFPK